MQNQKSKTLILTFSGIAVFVIGASLALFFLARSGEGKSFFVSNNAVDAAPVQTQASIVSFEKSEEPMTEDFFKFLVKEGLERNFSAEDLSQEGFIKQVIMPYVEEKAPDLYPSEEEIKVNIDADANTAEYLELMQTHLIVIAGLWQETLETVAANDVEKAKKIVMVSDVETNRLLDVAVPLEERDYHIKAVQASVATKRILEYGVIDRTSDPLASLFYIGGAGKVEDMIMELVKRLTS